ncbi:hypothetical protein [Phytomonospora endophytica]|uniref:Uncharacterized protein n=1 Tax=Phytomonospora endophytica TaxID=714109 RepID=A0A841FKZ9_9ACTN|nr:hypothetical protein [Phytomonospora endophytica]MBB6036585.1 hypothetical protein [Phytomonospora endophytica]GIG65906.1 hypothetical protein Pen01_22010 [Phytomonospora endophytica]
MAIVGVNPNDAAASGTQTTGIAGGFKGLAEGFRTAVGDAAAAAGKDPGVTGWEKDFGADWVGALTEVEKHGVAVGNNHVSGAGQGTTADTGIGKGYQGIKIPALAAINR